MVWFSACGVIGAEQQKLMQLANCGGTFKSQVQSTNGQWNSHLQILAIEGEPSFNILWSNRLWF
jgi:hypothetical protein